MKKLLSIAFCAAVGSTFAAAEVGTVGVTKIDTGASNTVIAVSYDDILGGAIALSNLVKTATLELGDQMAVFYTNNVYDTWTLAESGGVKYWAKNEKTFFASAGGIAEGTSDGADIVTKSVGTGLWIVQKCEGGKTPQPIYLYGKPSTTTTSTSTAGKWALVGNPLQVPAKPEMESPEVDDQIVIPGADGKLKYYNYKIGKGWRTGKDALPAIPAGTGCWVWTRQYNKKIYWTPVAPE